MEGKTSTKASNSSEDPSSTPRKRSGVEEGGVKRKVEEQTEKVAKVARCREGTAGLTSEAELTDSGQDGSGKNSDDEESGEKVLNRSGVKKSVDEEGEMKQELKKVAQEKETIVAILKKSEDEKDQVKKELNKAKQDMMNYRYLTGKSENEKNHLEQELKNVELENYHLKQEMKAATQERDDSKRESEQEMKAVIQERDDFKHKSEQRKLKLDKVLKVLEELQEKIECPVCLAVPREGPVPCCPSGHITCSPCLGKLRAEGKLECPTCREPMGEGKSALAKVVIESMEHECSFQGCDELVAFKDYKKHQVTCEHRLVVCPAVGCDKTEPFCHMLDHARDCQGICIGDKINGDVFSVDKFAMQAWRSPMFEADGPAGKIFFLRVQKVNSMFSLEVVMLGTQEECEEYTMEVSVINPDTETVAIKASFKPRPIVATNDTDDFSLTFKQVSLAKMLKYNKERKRLDFIKIKMQTV